jgi:hypothetical protein
MTTTMMTMTTTTTTMTMTMMMTMARRRRRRRNPMQDGICQGHSLQRTSPRRCHHCCPRPPCLPCPVIAVPLDAIQNGFIILMEVAQPTTMNDWYSTSKLTIGLTIDNSAVAVVDNTEGHPCP